MFLTAFMFYFQLAEGMAKHRNDCCIAIWDVNSKPSSDSMYMSERQRYSSDLSTSVTKPFIELGMHFYQITLHLGVIKRHVIKSTQI